MQQITGRLTADAIVKTIDGGKQVVNFSIADSETYKPKGQDEVKEISTFFNCSYWFNPAVAKVLRKGAVVQLNGRVSARPYQANTGDAAAALNFHTNRIEVLAYAAKKDSDSNSSQKTDPSKNTGNGQTIDDLPF